MLKGLMITTSLICSIACRTKGEANSAIRHSMEMIAEAQRQENLKDISRYVQDLESALGDNVGVPEDFPARYYQPETRSKPEFKHVKNYWERLHAQSKPSFPWIVNPTGDPTKMSEGLRQVGRPLIAATILCEIFPAESDYWRNEAVCAGNWLLSLQQENGLFAFPDIRANNSFFGRMIDSLLDKHPDALRDGWIIDDGGGGDLQYDHGICGVAMVQLYKLTGDEKYLQSAQRAAGWVIDQPVVPNWNYNAFSVWFLSELQLIQSEGKYGKEALKKATLGLLPGMQENGRWLDPHNAKLVYHSIITRGLLSLKRCMSPEMCHYPEISEHLELALAEAIRDVLDNGVTSNSVLTEVLSDALYYGLAPDNCETALNILLNAGIETHQDKQAPHIGFYIVNYLRFANEASKN